MPNSAMSAGKPANSTTESTNHLSQVTSARVRAALAGVPQQPTTEQVNRVQDSTDQPIPFSLTPAAEQLPGKVTVSVRGVPVTIDEPAWCEGHDDGPYSNLEDLVHYSLSAELPIPQPDGSTLPGVAVHLTQWPFATPDGNNRPHMSVDDDGTGATTALNSVAGLAFADRVRAYADEVERMARQLAVYEAQLNGGRS